MSAISVPNRNPRNVAGSELALKLRNAAIFLSFGSGSAWTQDFSSGEMIRSSYDQTLTISPCNIQYLYQGDAPGSYSNYNAIPWRIGLVTQTNSTC